MFNLVMGDWGQIGSIHSFQPKFASIEAEDCYGLFPFSSVVSKHHIVGANYHVAPFSPELPCPAKQFSGNIFNILSVPEVGETILYPVSIESYVSLRDSKEIHICCSRDSY